MFLSKLVLDPAHPQARRDLANAYEMHRTLSRAFTLFPDCLLTRFLWRLENTTSRQMQDGVIVLVQSSSQGNWRALPDQSGYAKIYPDKSVDLDRLLRNGRRYIFRLACNPTVTRGGKRYGLQREAEQLAWLTRQGFQHGFEVFRAEVGRSERITVRQGRSSSRITLQVVQFDGIATVTDVEKLGKALCNGIGHAKALGLGMLSLAPLPSVAPTV